MSFFFFCLVWIGAGEEREEIGGEDGWLGETWRGRGEEDGELVEIEGSDGAIRQ